MQAHYRSAINRDVPPAAPGEFRPVPIGPHPYLNRSEDVLVTDVHFGVVDLVPWIPPESPFAVQRTSGVTPNVCAANRCPVRPTPVMISSKIKRTL